MVEENNGITLEEAIEIAKKEEPNLVVDSICEFEDCYVIAMQKIKNPSIYERIDLPALRIEKSDGSVGVFFPLDYSDEYLDSGKIIE